MRVEIVTITPELARVWLTKNHGNRTVSEKTVKQYADDMASGNWQLTNQGIGFYRDGRLADGQHRLHAIIMSGVSVQMLVTYDLECSAVDGIDINRVRSLSDIMTIKNGMSITSQEVAVLRLAYGGDPKISPARMQLMADESLANLRIVTETFIGAPQELRKSPLLAALLCAYCSGVSLEVIRRFVRVLRLGMVESDSEGAAIALRDKILKGELSNGGGSQRLMQTRQSMLAIKGFAEGRGIKILRMTTNYPYPLLSIPK